MRTLGFILAVLFTFGFIPEVRAQLKLVPKDKLQKVNSPELSCDSSSLCFVTKHIVADQMSEDEAPKTFTFEFTNVGTSTIEVKHLVSTCSCVQAICADREVVPGASSEISLIYNPKGHPGKFERKVFVYTQDGDAPAAVLRLSVDVENNSEISDLYPISMGKIRLRRRVVRFQVGSDALEKIRFINVSGKNLHFDCDRIFLPECLEFEAPSTRHLEEAEIMIRYDSTKPGARDKVVIFLNGLGLPPSQASLTVCFE